MAIPSSKYALIPALAAAAAWCATLPYQGIATDSRGIPAPDTTHSVAFSLYGDRTSGALLWSSTQDLSTNKGLFSTSLEIPDSLFGSAPLYLAVSFDGGDESARTPVGSTPWAQRSGQADSASTSRIADSASFANRARFADSATAAHFADSASFATRARFTDSATAAHFADSAGFANRARLADSATAARFADSASFAMRARFADSATAARFADSARASSRADTAKIALHLIGVDSAALCTARDSIHLLAASIRSQVAAIAALRSFIATSSLAASSGIAWNLGVVYGSVTDSRDGRSYRTVKIGNQTWMAQNLDYAGTSGDSGKSYESGADSATKYGRLYNWALAMKLKDSCNTSSCATLASSTPQGLCPTGWHVPTAAEWDTLAAHAGGSSLAGITLKSASGWTNSGSGSDSLGFRALPGGSCDGTLFSGSGSTGTWWSRTVGTAAESAGSRSLLSSGAGVDAAEGSKSVWRSLRCLKD